MVNNRVLYKRVSPNVMLMSPMGSQMPPIGVPGVQKSHHNHHHHHHHHNLNEHTKHHVSNLTPPCSFSKLNSYGKSLSNASQINKISTANNNNNPTNRTLVRFVEAQNLNTSKNPIKYDKLDEHIEDGLDEEQHQLGRIPLQSSMKKKPQQLIGYQLLPYRKLYRVSRLGGTSTDDFFYEFDENQVDRVVEDDPVDVVEVIGDECDDNNVNEDYDYEREEVNKFIYGPGETANDDDSDSKNNNKLSSNNSDSANSAENSINSI